MLLLLSSLSFAQQPPKKIIVNNADNFDKNELEHPGVIVAIGNVEATHEGVKLYSNEAIIIPGAT